MFVDYDIVLSKEKEVNIWLNRSSTHYAVIRSLDRNFIIQHLEIPNHV